MQAILPWQAAGRGKQQASRVTVQGAPGRHNGVPDAPLPVSIVEAFRIYISAIPCLAERITERLAEALEEGVIDTSDPNAVRDAHEAAREAALARLKQARSAYYVIWHPKLRASCPQCDAELRGAYWELANPISARRVLVPVRLVHELVAHRRTGYDETLQNLNATAAVIESRDWDVPAVLKVLEGLAVPPAVATELSAHATKAAALLGVRE